MAVTQKQIAEKLGLSREYVTRALNGDPTVPSKTRRRVQAAARRLGYNEYSNRDARSMVARRYGRRLKSGIISVLFPRLPIIKSVPLRQLPLFAPLFDGVEIEAHRQDLGILLCSSDQN